jgi:glyceraldehyde-3-phosphate dehydrogenase (NADP+)
MWEIGKNYKDAASEFDRTVQFAEEVMDVVKSDQEFLSASWQSIGSTRAFVRRAAIGILLCLGPYNYPLNETYATLIPALLMGNIVLLKIPTIGGLSHLLTSKCTFELCLLSHTIISIL